MSFTLDNTFLLNLLDPKLDHFSLWICCRTLWPLPPLDQNGSLHEQLLFWIRHNISALVILKLWRNLPVEINGMKMIRPFWYAF